MGFPASSPSKSAKRKGDRPPEPSTPSPSKRRRTEIQPKESESDDSDVANDSDGEYLPTPDDSPRKKSTKKQPKKSPSKRSSAKKSPTKKEVMAPRIQRWENWCRRHLWSKELDPDYKQKVGDKVMHKSDGESAQGQLELKRTLTCADMCGERNAGVHNIKCK